MNHPLPEIELLKRCPASWREMKGNDRVRFCEICKHNVYNLSNMTAEEAFQRMEDTEGRFCARFYQRPDGSVVTADCSKLERAANWTRNLVGTALACVGLGALAMPLFPVMGQSKTASRDYLINNGPRKIANLERDIAVCKDPEEKKDLIAMRDSFEEELRLAKRAAAEN